MPLDTVIFDIDGLLIDSEPLWNEAADEVFNKYGITLTTQCQNESYDYIYVVSFRIIDQC